MTATEESAGTFSVLETTIEAVQQALQEGRLSARELVQHYLDRIDAYDRSGPAINSIISVHPQALEEAERLDRALADSGPVGPLHGVPVVLKDQMDAVGTPTTLGSVLLKDFYPARDAFVTERLKAAGAIILAKATLGELGGGDTHGTLFGSTRNPYALDRTAGGSSGGSGAAIAANLATVAIGQEGHASIRRPAAWNCIVGLRPTAGLVSRTGVFAGWPGIAGSLGPMARTVRDVALLLGVIAGYDPEDPLTAMGAPHVLDDYTAGLAPDALQGARIGVIRESIGRGSEPDSADYAKVAAAFDRAVGELAEAGAALVDPLEIPDLAALLATRSGGDREGDEAGFAHYMSRHPNPPFASYRELMATPGYVPRSNGGTISPGTSAEQLRARQTLMISLMKLMQDHRLDAVVHPTVEHTPTPLPEGDGPPSVNSKGSTSINTFLVFLPALSVPAGFTSDALPAGITFLGRPYADQQVLRLGYAYEQATRHRQPPTSAPALPA